MSAAPSRRWCARAELYWHFGKPYAGLDWSPAAARAMFAYESSGAPLAAPWTNGYYVGKHWLDWQVAAWREGLADGTSTTAELLSDASLPHKAVAMATGDERRT